MRVLWVCNIMLPVIAQALSQEYSVREGWLSGILGRYLETENGAANAREKLDRKNLDFIVLNSLRDAGAGFGCDTNVVSLIDRVSCVELPLMSKREVAARIVDRMEKLLNS